MGLSFPMITSPPLEFLGHGVKGQIIDNRHSLARWIWSYGSCKTREEKLQQVKTQREVNPIGGHKSYKD